MQGCREDERKVAKFSIVVMVSENDGMGEDSHTVDLKCTAFNLPNEHANSSACFRRSCHYGNL